jgi:hypothetical protein
MLADRDGVFVIEDSRGGRSNPFDPTPSPIHVVTHRRTVKLPQAGPPYAGRHEALSDPVDGPGHDGLDVDDDRRANLIEHLARALRQDPVNPDQLGERWESW